MRNSRLKTGNEGWLTSYADLITNLLIFFVLILSASTLQTGKLDRMAHLLNSSQTQNSLTEAQKIIKEAIQKENLHEKVEVELTDSGLELSFNSGLTFASGSAEILPEMQMSLEKVMKLLPPYAQRYFFAVEGHTDEVPIAMGSAFSSNWDLGAKRALVVRDRLEAVGVPKKKMRIEAYADTRPLPQEKVQNLDLEKIRAKQRRVVIRIF